MLTWRQTGSSQVNLGKHKLKDIKHTQHSYLREQRSSVIVVTVKTRDHSYCRQTCESRVQVRSVCCWYRPNSAHTWSFCRRHPVKVSHRRFCVLVHAAARQCQRHVHFKRLLLFFYSCVCLMGTTECVSVRAWSCLCLLLSARRCDVKSERMTTFGSCCL